jgi:uncharacterized protein involved in outer membrane biogenesis
MAALMKFGIVLLSLMALLVATAAVIPRLIDWNAYKSEILQAVN